MKTEPLPSVPARYLTLFACCLLLLFSTKIIPAGAEESCTPPPDPTSEGQGCTSPSPMSPLNTWPQNTSVSVVINADQFSYNEYICLKAAFDHYNDAAGASGNSSGVRFNVAYSSAAVATLSGPYLSGGGNLAVNAPGVTNGFQVNRPQGMRPHALGEEYIGVDGGRRNSAVIFLNPNITDCVNMTQLMAHEIGHTLGLKDCCSCPRASTVMVCGTCAENGTDANGNHVCARADYNNASNGRSGPTTCDNTSIKQAGQYDPNTLNQPPPAGGGGGGGGDPNIGGGDGSGGVGPCGGGGGACGYNDYCNYFCGVCYDSMMCYFMCPVVVDAEGDGFDLTDEPGGVYFDVDGDGQQEHVAWTSAGADEAWLFLDRNGNGTVDDGRELFGDLTPQPPAAAPNGYAALAEFDKLGSGGNGDGVIDRRDEVYAYLRLWQDLNHNGVSEAEELHTLPSLDVAVLHLDYKRSKRTDDFGNEFRFRAKVDDARGANVGRWSWDVFLKKRRAGSGGP